MIKLSAHRGRAYRARHHRTSATRLRVTVAAATSLAVVLATVQASTAPAAFGSGSTPPTPTRGNAQSGQSWSGADVRTSPSATSGGTTTAIPAGPINSNGTGAWGATPLSTAAAWQVSEQTGAFTWSYPFPGVAPAAGPTPQLGLSYNSALVDGETGSTNNQPSVVGEGWSLSGVGSIDRAYIPCPLDDSGKGPSTGDLCWSNDNATLTMAGHSGPLVRNSDGTWKLRDDDGTTVTYVNPNNSSNRANDSWKITTPDGTQYFYGLGTIPNGTATNSRWTVPVYGNDSGEPCNSATYALSSCSQAWRWNLDYVIDPHGNREAFYYGTETNKYSPNSGVSTPATYTRGGFLDHVDYGIAPGAAPSSAPLRIQLKYAERCKAGSGCSTAAASTDYPDTPWADQCTSNTNCTSTQQSPTFWTSKMLTEVHAQLTSGPTDVTTWTLGHTFPDPGDGQNPALWLQTVTRAGADGTTMPATTFSGTPMANTVGTASSLPMYYKYRLSWILTETGSLTSVSYNDPRDSSSNLSCDPNGTPNVSASTDPSTNHKLCFPVLWAATANGTPQQVWFNKYVAVTVDTIALGGKAIKDSTTPLIGRQTDTITHYDYTVGQPSWRYNLADLVPANQRTWNDYAGFNKVRVMTGDLARPATTVTDTFYQGLNGDRTCPNPPGCSTLGTPLTAVVTSSGPTVSDSLWLAGQVRESRRTLGPTGAEVSDTLNTPYVSAVTANDGTHTARFVGEGTTAVTTDLSTLSGASNGTRTTQTSTSYDASFRPTQVSDLGDTATASDDRCTTVSYPTTQNGLLAYPKETITVAATCGTTPSLPAAAISDTRYSWDNQAFGTGPTKGDPTTIQTVDAYSAGAPSAWRTTTTTFDALGRPTQVTDPLSRVTKTAYTPAAGSPLTQTVVTNPMTWTTTTSLDGRFGVPTQVTDPNGKVTTATYDGFGRLTDVWATDRPKASNPKPTTHYDYTVIQTGPDAIATTSLTPYGTATSYVLYDGLGRQIQTQAPAEGGGTDYTDTVYDTAGNIAATNDVYWNDTTSPSTTLYLPANQQNIGGHTDYSYDQAGRVTNAAFLIDGTTYSTTTTRYGGDRVTVTPPTGGIPTTTISDARGHTTDLIQWLGTPGGSGVTSQDTTFTYDPRDAMASMTDPAGNRWTWTHDLHGNTTATTDPDKGASSATFDAADRMLTSTDATGTTLTWTYDALDRKKSITQTRSGTTTTLAAWAYDSLAKGQPDSSTSYLGTAAYTQTITGYDNAYRPTGTDTAIPSTSQGLLGGDWTTHTWYLQDGSIGNQQEPALPGMTGETLHFRYTNLGHLLAENDGSLSIVARAIYTHYGQLAQFSQGQGTVINKSYLYQHGTGRLLNALTLRGITQGNNPQTGGIYSLVSNLTYTYDQAGNVTSEANTSHPGYQSTTLAGNDLQCFSYDALRELTNAWTPDPDPTKGYDCSTAPSTGAVGGPAPYWRSWTYDTKTGNRTSVIAHMAGTTDTYTYPAAGSPQPHTLTSVSHSSGAATDTYSYDPLGQTLTRPGQNFTWTSQGRIGTATAGGQTETRVYTADNTLLLEADPSYTTLYLGDTEIHNPTGNTDPSKLTLSRYYTAFGQVQAQQNITTTAYGTVFYDTDQQNTATTASYARGDAGGITATRYTMPFGQNRGTPTGSWPTSHNYLDKPTDRTSGLTITGARDYDPTLGRFLSADPILDTASPQQTNGYSYANNNPVTLTDPTGLRPGCLDEGSCTTSSNGQGGVIAHDTTQVTPSWAGQQTDPADVARFAKLIATPHSDHDIYTATHFYVNGVPQQNDNQTAAYFGALYLINQLIAQGQLSWSSRLGAWAGPGNIPAWNLDFNGPITDGGILLVDAVPGTDGAPEGHSAETVPVPGYGVNASPQRVIGPWSMDDLKQGAFGRSPRSFGRPDLHHADQMPGSGIHEVLPQMHRGNTELHPNKYNQGVTPEMRQQDRQLHWWYRSQEMGGWDALGPDYYFDNWPSGQ